MCSEVLVLELVDFLHLTHKLGVKIIFVIFDQTFARALEAFVSMNNLRLHKPIIYQKPRVCEIMGEVDLLYLLPVRLLHGSFLLLLFELEIHDLLQKAIVSDLLGVVSQMPDAVFDLVDFLEHFEIAAASVFFQDFGKHLFNDIWIATFHGEVQCLLLLVDLKQKRNFLNNGMLISN